MTTNIKEIGFEEFIEHYLLNQNGYRKRESGDYDRAKCLDGQMVLEFIQQTQLSEWQKLVEGYGADAAERFLDRLSKEVASRGVLDVLRGEIADRGARFRMAFFRPETAMNTETSAEYAANILSVTRQVKFSQKDEKSIDMVLFLNGLPLFTVELKNQLTGQSVRDAMLQYKRDRSVKEPLFAFKRCLAHFAVDAELAYFTTRLENSHTRFMPFNRGNNGGAGNPANPEGYRTAYLWEDVWTRDGLMEIVGRFVQVQRTEKTDRHGRVTRGEALIFPRWHQREAVRRIVAHAREHGAGQNYLIQHSAGSGKSNTIAWTAHRLAALHDAQDKKIFDTILVVTDRRVIDRMLRDTLAQFEQVAGVVKAITESAAELKAALEAGEKIIVTTLHKFPFILDAAGTLPGKRFAVIVDEAHSSQTGEAASKLRQVLTAKDLDSAEAEEAEEVSTDEDYINKELRARKVHMSNLSYFAFTATPKQKTLELFGTLNPADGRFYPFSMYTMRQAVEERFIIDVLRNYTTYRSYFSLLKKIQNDPEVEKSKAERLLIGYVERHEQAIEKKTQVIVEHFLAKGAEMIDGEAKAMVVTRSRLHAVRFKLAFDKYLKERGCPFRALVAFTGRVSDGSAEYSEPGMNGVSESATAEEFKKVECRFLIVAEKFQTGFDQPLLAVMYVDKKLSGVNAVQTLSRLNRTAPKKEEVFILDFVNETEDIKESFQPYYETTILSEATDPNILHDLERDVLGFRLFNRIEIDRFIAGYAHFPPMTPAQVNAALEEYVGRFNGLLEEEQMDFRTKCRDYVRRYAFVSQVVPFEDPKLEKLYVFLRMLMRKLPTAKIEMPTEVLEAVDMSTYGLRLNSEDRIELEKKSGLLEPMTAGETGGKPTDEMEALSKIIKEMNDRFGGDLGPEGATIIRDSLEPRLLADEDLVGAVRENAPDAAKIVFDESFGDLLVKMYTDHFAFYQKVSSNPELKKWLNDRLFEHMVRKIQEKKS